MDDRPSNKMASGNFFRNISNEIKLIIRLIGDGRVHPLLKILPLFPTLYFIFPDLLFGPIDDGLLMWLGAYLFVEMCPPEVVEEHRSQLLGIDTHISPEMGDDVQVIDASFVDSEEK